MGPEITIIGVSSKFKSEILDVPISVALVGSTSVSLSENLKYAPSLTSASIVNPSGLL